MTFIAVISYLVLVYFVVLEVQILALAAASYRVLRKDTFAGEHGRLHDMLTSDTTPPVSIIMPAYNEEVGITEAVRSMAMLKYPKLEIIVVNDGSADATVERMVAEFQMKPVEQLFRPTLDTQPVRRIYRSTLPLPVILLDKENGGKGDAINAGLNVARYPYFLATDADIILDDECLLRAMRHVVKDRTRTVAVGGNVRPLNGSKVRRGKVTGVGMPASGIEVIQIIEYIRSFLGARPAWSKVNSLLLISGALGVFRKDVVAEVGGFRHGHLGEDMELTMRIHRHMRRQRKPYRIVYAPDAVAWTEVPGSREILRRQRVRWHRGLMQVIGEYKSMLFNPRYGFVGMVGWPAFVAFEFLAPVVEFLGWMIVPLALILGLVNWAGVWPLLAAALLLGGVNSLVAMFLDERFGYYNHPRHALTLLIHSAFEHFGIRQRTVWWRVRAMFWTGRTKTWGNMERTGVGNLASAD